jgi:hypothetical protein
VYDQRGKLLVSLSQTEWRGVPLGLPKTPSSDKYLVIIQLNETSGTSSRSSAQFMGAHQITPRIAKSMELLMTITDIKATPAAM